MNRAAYEEYKQEHPEELVNLEKMKARQLAIKEYKQKLIAEKQRRIEECRRYLYGE